MTPEERIQCLRECVAECSRESGNFRIEILRRAFQAILDDMLVREKKTLIMLDPDVIEEVEQALAERGRPVRHIDP